MVLSRGEVIDGYSVVLSLGRGGFTEDYRVRNAEGKMYLLKLYRSDSLSPTDYSQTGRIREIELFEQLRLTGIPRYETSGTMLREGVRYPYVILEFVPGETLRERVEREPFRLYSEVVGLCVRILEVLKGLHLHYETLVLNSLSLDSVILDARSEEPKPILMDLSLAKSLSKTGEIPLLSLSRASLSYLATEVYSQNYSTRSDLFSVGVLLYRLLYGVLPWTIQLPVEEHSWEKERDAWLEVRARRLSFPQDKDSIIGYDERVERVLRKALSPDIEQRFTSADEFMSALKGEIEVEDIDRVGLEQSSAPPRGILKVSKARGRGFAAVAGLTDLKVQLKRDVIDVLHEPAKYAEYGLTIPNGMLLYGPPGCGKTFFAKCFAEEVGFNFMLLTPSSLKSRYVNATQENIAKMFDEARKNAPTLIFIDEINELVPNRDGDVHEMSRSAVNEMLAQMDRTGEQGIFVIGATNYPHQIDPAMLRAGRLEHMVYLPLPDKEVREELFRMYLKSRPLELGVDYEQLASATAGYVSADIERLVNEAARTALAEGTRIGMAHLNMSIKLCKPSLSPAEREKYERIHIEVEQGGGSNNRRKIGF